MTSLELKDKIINELSPYKYSQTESHMILWCPFCDDRSHSHAHLYFAKDTLKWHCFMCGTSGNRPFELLEKYGIHINYYDYLDLFLKDVDVVRESVELEEDNEELKEFAEQYKNIQPNTDAYNYLKTRLISDYDIEFSWKLWDKYPEYIFWVYFDANYKIKYYIGRNYVNPKPKKKYLNAKNLSVPFVVFHKQDPLFIAKKEKYGIFLVEGIFDAYNTPFTAVPLFSKNINSSLITDISNYCFTNNAFPIIAVDSDAEKERYTIAKKLFDNGVNTIGLFTFGKDEKDFGEGKHKFLGYKEFIPKIKYYNPYVKL
jgi:hypothetical protein